jgi:hypothetical protein
MPAGDLESALALSRSGAGAWTAHADPNYESANGMFGGWTAAMLLRAVCAEVDSKATPSALTVNFVHKIEPGSDLWATGNQSSRRPISRWRSPRLYSPSDARRTDTLRSRCQIPPIPPRSLRCTQPLDRVANEFPIVQSVGFLLSIRRARTRPLGCVRRAGDWSTMPNSRYSPIIERRGRSSGATDPGRAPHTLSVYFHATESELTAVGDDEILSEAFGTRGADSTSEEHLRLWSRRGALLATSVQMDWFR